MTAGVPRHFHHIRLNKVFFMDLAMWKMFLSKWNEHSLFLQSSPSPAQNLELYTDAAGSIGFGGYFQRVVSQLLTSAHAVEQTMGYYYWMVRALSHCCCLHHMAPLLTGKHLQFCCDKLSAVPSINPGNCKTPRITDFVRRVMLRSIQHNFTVRAHHVTGVSHEIADALSRFQM